jgi:uncharacterized membrane protein
MAIDGRRKPTFVQALRASPRKQRRLAWLVGCAVVLAVAAAVVLLLPNTSGAKEPGGPAPAHSGGNGTFWTVFGVILICFFVVWAYSLVRLVWRLRKGDVEAAGSDGDTWRNPQRDLERALRSSSD